MPRAFLALAVLFWCRSGFMLVASVGAICSGVFNFVFETWLKRILEAPSEPTLEKDL